jgi:hypothetical protein
LDAPIFSSEGNTQAKASQLRTVAFLHHSDSRISSTQRAGCDQLVIAPCEARFPLASASRSGWEPLGNLGAVEADAAGIAYAVEREWRIISASLHSASFTEVRRAG